MKQLPLYVTLIASIALSGQLQTMAYGDSEQVRQDLEHSRNSLLNQEDQLKRSYLETVASIDNLNKQLEQMNARKISIEQALQRNDQSLKDLEYSLRNLR
jgi:chromosome segregation ATPase